MPKYSSALTLIDESCRNGMSQRMLTLSDSVEVDLAHRSNSQVRIQAASIKDWWFTSFEGRGSVAVSAGRRALKFTDHALLILPLGGRNGVLNGRWFFPAVGTLGLSRWDDADCVVSKGDFRYIIACIPTVQIECCSGGDIPYGRAIVADHGAGRILGSLLQSVASEAMRGKASEPLSVLLPGLARLMVTALGQNERAGAAELVAAQGRKQRALDYIRRHFADPGISLDRVARHVGVSRRQLCREFSLECDTYARHVRELRLEKAKRQLVGQPRRSITDLSYECGFNSPTVFGRTFRNAVGMSPREFRAAACRQDPAKLPVPDA